MGRPGVIVSFDLDGTLTDHAFVDGVWNEGLPELVSRRLHVPLDEARDMCARAYAREGDDSVAWYRLPYWLAFFGIEDVRAEDLIERYTGRIRAFEDGLRSLARLSDMGVGLVLFSNATRAFLDRELEVTGLKRFFGEVVSLPDDWGTLKACPDAFVRLGSLAGGVLVHVGDHVRYDYEVPMSVGVRAYHVWRGTGRRLQCSMETLDTLVEALGRDKVIP
ncbi:MAG TPA: HAD family hydrolase [Deltaproteobacteria bacterium]|nr:HAD family hydrolase [Deltaproteobacteria bacterium]HOM29551.1 HAD family hydrolase [Deltaproteobacteria bacterium]